MTDSMIERVARALAACDYLGSSAQEQQRYADKHWLDFEEEALSAIDAMREPTEAMLDAGRRANALTPGNCLGLQYVAPDPAWRAMVEETLK